MSVTPPRLAPDASQRCARCAQVFINCLCAFVVPIPTATRFIFVIHWTEWKRTMNTGRFAHLALPNSEVRLRGLPGGSFLEIPSEDKQVQPLVLYPSTDACPLDALGTPGPFHLYVPDGTWRQTRRACYREPLLARARRVKLPTGSESALRLRKQSHAGRFSTWEAVGLALTFLESPEVARDWEAGLAGLADRLAEPRRNRARSAEAAMRRRTEHIQKSP